MQNTINAFLEGITTDLHPLTMPETALTSALNASIITFNGNELILQNDMGNTLIKDSITGNVMSLNDGFIPIGMKEHGGVLYIASYNPDTNEGELGTIPSPIIHYTYNSESKSGDTTVSDISLNSDDYLQPRLNNNAIYISDQLLHGGDKFISVLNITGIDNIYQRNIYTFQGTGVEQYPILSNFTDNKKGWYKANLYAVTESSKQVLLDKAISTQQAYINNSGTKFESKYWFVPYNSTVTIDSIRTKSLNLFKTYPNIPSGKLAILFELELHDNLQYSKNISYDDYLPSTYIATDSDNNKDIWVIVNGFEYKADCAIQPEKIVVRCNEGNLPLYQIYVDGSGAINSKQISNIFYINNWSSDASDHLFRTKIDATTYLITRQKFAGQSLSIRDLDTTYVDNSIFAVKLESLNQDVKIKVDLYIKDPDKPEGIDSSYILYRTDILPSFNPAEQLGYKVNTITRQQYYDFTNPEGTYDVLVFNNVDFNSGELACFLYREDDPDNTDDPRIYDYDSISYKYVPKQNFDVYNRSHTRDTYRELRTWIYPQYLTGTEADISTGLAGVHQCFPWVKKELIETGNDGLPKLFVRCSDRPVVFGYYEDDPDNKVLRNLLLPVFYDGDTGTGKERDIYEYYLNAQKLYFDTSFTNIAGLSANSMKKYCLYGVNLNVINLDLDYTSFFKNEDCAVGGMYGNLVSPNFYGDLFFDKSGSVTSTTNLSDVSLCTCDGNKFVILYDGPDQRCQLSFLGMNIPKKSGDTFLHRLPIILPANPYRLYNFAKGSYIDFWNGHEDNHPYISRMWKSSGEHIGCLNSEIKFCPGYLKKSDRFDININLIDYPHSSLYLYKDSINIALKNFGNDYLQYLKLYWVLDKSPYYCQVEPLDIQDQVILNVTEGFYINDTVSENVPPYTITENIANTQYLKKIQISNLGDGLFTHSVLCQIPNTAFKYNFKLSLNCSLEKWERIIQNSKYHSKSSINDPRLVIVSPTILASFSNNDLTRAYKADYQIVEQIPIGVGYVDDKANTVKTNLELDRGNLLIDQNNLPATKETLRYIPGIDRELLQSPAEIGWNNTFENDKGYLKLNGSDQVSPNEYQQFLQQNVSLNTQGLYILNINYCSPESYEKLSRQWATPKFKLTISNGPNITEIESPQYKSQIMFYVPLGCEGVYSISLAYNWMGNSGSSTTQSKFSDLGSIDINALGTNTRSLNPNATIAGTVEKVPHKAYIKNLGLYLVLKSADVDKFLLDNDNDCTYDKVIKSVDDSKIVEIAPKYYDQAVLEAVYCYKEQQSDKNLGCLAKEFDGFQALPDFSYQTCAGVYILGYDYTTPELLSVKDESIKDSAEKVLSTVSSIHIKSSDLDLNS